MKVFIKPYKMNSMGAKELANSLNDSGVYTRRIKKTNSNYKHNPREHLVVNWGDSSCQSFDNMLNRPENIALASNKLRTFDTLIRCGVSTLPLFTDKLDANNYLTGGENRVVYCRTLLKGTKGRGIVVATNPKELVDAKLYTAGITDPNRVEYRVHVFHDKVLHMQEKRRRAGYRENPNFSDTIRNINGGWVFAISNVNPSQEVKDACIAAVKALGLDFGGVDVLVSSDGKPYVLEVNTACGLHGTTIIRYTEAIKDFIGG